MYLYVKCKRAGGGLPEVLKRFLPGGTGVNSHLAEIRRYGYVIISVWTNNI